MRKCQYSEYSYYNIAKVNNTNYIYQNAKGSQKCKLSSSLKHCIAPSSVRNSLYRNLIKGNSRMWGVSWWIAVSWKCINTCDDWWDWQQVTAKILHRCFSCCKKFSIITNWNAIWPCAAFENFVPGWCKYYYITTQLGCW